MGKYTYTKYLAGTWRREGEMYELVWSKDRLLMQQEEDREPEFVAQLDTFGREPTYAKEYPEAVD